MKKTLLVLTCALLTGTVFANSDITTLEQEEDTLFYTTELQSVSLGDYVIGQVNKIEFGKDGRQVYIDTYSGVNYSTAVSVISDTVTGGKLGDIQTGSKIKVYYTDFNTGMNLLIGDKVEILNNKSYAQEEISLITKDLNKNYLKIADSFVNKINNKTKYLSSIDKQQYINSLTKSLDSAVSKFSKEINTSAKMKNIYYALLLIDLRIQAL